MSSTNDVISTTLRKLLPESVDQKFRTVPLLDTLKSSGGVEKLNGGQKIDVAVGLFDHAAATQFSTGTESFATTFTDVHRTASFDWAMAGVPVYITEKDRLQNSGELAIIDIAKSRMDAQLGNLMRLVEERIVKGQAAASNPLTDIQSLNGIDTYTGWLEEGAYGSGQENSVGGLSKATYTDWNNVVGNASDAFATNGLDQMRLIHDSCSVYGPFGAPSLVLASLNSYRLYWSQVQAQERFVKADNVLDAGRAGLAWGGGVMRPSINLGFTGGSSTDASMYFLNPEAMKLFIHRDADFDMVPFTRASSQALDEAYIRVMLQLVGLHLGSLGVLVNAES